MAVQDEDELMVEVAFDSLNACVPDHFAMFPWEEAPDELLDVLKDVSPAFQAAPSGWVFVFPERYTRDEVQKPWFFKPPPALSIDVEGIGTVGWLP